MASSTTWVTLAALSMFACTASAAFRSSSLPTIFETIISTGMPGYNPTQSNLDIVPSNSIYTIATEVEVIRANKTAMITFPKGDNSTTTVLSPARITEWSKLQLFGNNKVTIGRRNNILPDGNCSAKFELAANRSLDIITQGVSELTIDCFVAPATTKLGLTVDGAAVTFAASQNYIEELEISTTKGTNLVTVNAVDGVDVKRILMKEVLGELRLDVRKPSTQLVWDIAEGFGGELWIKTTSACPLSAAGVYTGANLGNSKYCCGPAVDVVAKVCPPGSVKAGTW